MVYSFAEKWEYLYASSWLPIYEVFASVGRTARPLSFMA